MNHQPLDLPGFLDDTNKSSVKPWPIGTIYQFPASIAILGLRALTVKPIGETIAAWIAINRR